MSDLAAATEPLTYRAHCDRCGGRGGQAIHGPREWVDCDCLDEAPCALCGDPVDVGEEDLLLIILDGRAQAVCHDCFIQEPDDD